MCCVILTALVEGEAALVEWARNTELAEETIVKVGFAWCSLNDCISFNITRNYLKVLCKDVTCAFEQTFRMSSLFIGQDNLHRCM